MSKNRTYIIVLIGVLLIIFNISGCKKKNDPTPKEQKISSLAFTWKATQVSLDGYDVSSYFNGFTLTISSDYTYSTTGGNSPNPWPTSGVWSFTKNTDGSLNLDKVMRDDGLEILIQEINNTSLELSFTHDASMHQSGRTEGISGVYNFTFTNQ